MTDATDIAALRELLSHENRESDHHVGVTVTTLRLLLSKADQLEAERQRADDAEKERDRIDRRNAELNSTLERWSVERAENANEIEALKAKLATPVALNSSTVMSRNYVISAIHAAGFTTAKVE